MGTVIDRVTLARGGWRNRHSALHLAVSDGQGLSSSRLDAIPMTSTCWSMRASIGIATSRSRPLLR